MTRNLHDNIVQLTEHTDYRFTMHQLQCGKSLKEIRAALMERGYTFVDAEHVIEDVQMTLQLENDYLDRSQWLITVVAVVVLALVLFAVLFLSNMIVQ